MQKSSVFAAAGSPQPNTLPVTTPLTELHSSILAVSNLERAFNLDTCIISLSLSGDIERRPECKKVQIRTYPSISFGKKWRSFL